MKETEANVDTNTSVDSNVDNNVDNNIIDNDNNIIDNDNSVYEIRKQRLQRLLLPNYFQNFSRQISARQ